MRVSATIATLSICLNSLAQPAGDNTSPSFFIPTEKTIYYSLGERKIPIQLSQYGEDKSIFLINLHANEITSIEAAQRVLESKGGTLVRIGNGKDRVIRFRYKGQYYSFDPNRMFSREGIKQSLEENGRVNEGAIDEIEYFAQRILDLMPEETRCIVALHNNTNNAYSIRSYLPGNERAHDANLVYENPKQDPDDIVLTTNADIYHAMAALKYNSILQDNDHAKKDGSLSVWSGEKNRCYVNIETEHGRLQQYIEMLEKLYDVLTEYTQIVH